MFKEDTVMNVVNEQHPNMDEWLKDIEALKQQYKSADEEIHMVVYTDGGCRPPPRGPGGWGLHGYIYIYRKPTQGHGCKGFLPTSEGYVNGAKESDITVLHYIDGYGSIAPNSTNNEAELMGFYRSLELIDKLKPKTVLFRPDSEYVLNGTTKWLELWKSENWERRGGQPIANIELWKKVNDLQEKINLVTNCRWSWIKGHSDDVGNSKADASASLGVNVGLNGYNVNCIERSDIKGYWAPEVSYCKMLSEPKWYFSSNVSTNKNINGKEYYIYYQGTHTDDIETLGKPISDAVYSVVALYEPDIVLEAISKKQGSLESDVRGAVVVGELGNILKPLVYNAIQKNGAEGLYRAPGKVELIDPQKLPITTELQTPRLAFRAIDCLNKLGYKLLDYLGGSLVKDGILNDLTDYVFETNLVKDKEVTKIKLAAGSIDAVLKLPVSFNGKGGKTEVTRPFTVGLDLPRRNTLNNATDYKPKLYILTWPEPGEVNAFRYACILETTQGVGIWSAYYSNLCFSF